MRALCVLNKRQRKPFAVTIFFPLCNQLDSVIRCLWFLSHYWIPNKRPKAPFAVTFRDVGHGLSETAVQGYDGGVSRNPGKFRCETAARRFLATIPVRHCFPHTVCSIWSGGYGPLSAVP